MYEILLNGILHIFALITCLNHEKRDTALALVREYLNSYLGITETTEYIGLYEELLDFYGSMPDFEAVCPANAAKVSEGLKNNLPRLEQYVFLLRVLKLARLLAPDDELSDRLLEDAAGIFDIPPRIFEEMRLFTFKPEIYADLNENFLLIAQEGLNTEKVSCRLMLKTSWSTPVLIWRIEEVSACFAVAMDGTVSLNENPINPFFSYYLSSGSLIRDAYGGVVYFNEIEAEYLKGTSDAPRIEFEAENVNFRFPGSNNGVHNFSFREASGRLIGIMGGSGVGKSTLLSILNGTLKPDSGRILVNGNDLYESAEKLRGVIGMIPQDDLLFEELTVYQNLYFSARLCLADLPEKEIHERVAHLLRELNQLETRDLKVGNPLEKTISGGQRKRLNIALELVREPAIMFVDEPTSGLSSADSENVMNLLKSQAAKGKLVFVIIHQPSSNIFKMFDSLWILDKGGYPVYMGNPLEAYAHFSEAINLAGAGRRICANCGNVTPEQIFNIIEIRKIDEAGQFTRERRYSPEFWHKLYLEKCTQFIKSGEPTSTASEVPQGLHTPSWIEQVLLFFRRNLRSKIANRQYMLVTLLEAPLLGWIIAAISKSTQTGGYVFAENKYLAVFYFMSVIAAIFLGLSVSAEEIVKDRRILKREKFLHLSWSGYILSKFSYLMCVSGLQALLFVSVTVWVLQIPDMFWKMWLVLFSCSMFAGALGLNVSSAFKTVVTIYILIPLLLIPQMLLSGVVIRFGDLASAEAGHNYVPVLGEVMASRWGLEALVVEQFGSNSYQENYFDVDLEISRDEYVIDYLISEMHSKLDFLFLKTELEDKRAKDLVYLEAVRNGLRYIEEIYGSGSGFGDSVFSIDSFKREEMEAVKEYLKEAGKYFEDRKSAAIEGKRKIDARLLAEYGKEGYIALKRDNQNRHIEHLVLNREDLDSIRLSGTRFIQLSDPIYQPVLSSFGRAVFYSGMKRVGPWIVSTFAFNLMVLWLMTLALLMLLHFKLLARMVNAGSRYE
jgi:ABC-type multidrug transport system ATPase subunit